jgi:hypothetical protein
VREAAKAFLSAFDLCLRLRACVLCVSVSVSVSVSVCMCMGDGGGGGSGCQGVCADGLVHHLSTDLLPLPLH